MENLIDISLSENDEFLDRLPDWLIITFLRFLQFLCLCLTFFCWFIFFALL